LTSVFWFAWPFLGLPFAHEAICSFWTWIFKFRVDSVLGAIWRAQ
jgi:hypothetical protein